MEEQETRTEVVRVRIEHPVMFGVWFALGAGIILPILVAVCVLMAAGVLVLASGG